MTQAELNKLKEIHQDILNALKDKYGEIQVELVNDLGEGITSRMLNGEQIPGVEKWMYDIVNDFQEMLLSHPSITIPRH